ncbi:hypothetical protein CLOM_g1122 [Closterium sp. NIES-68]|nr:hypothetical protein CLOM_g1122 [Closterium sp. NIES-68]
MTAHKGRITAVLPAVLSSFPAPLLLPLAPQPPPVQGSNILLWTAPRCKAAFRGTQLHTRRPAVLLTRPRLGQPQLSAVLTAHKGRITAVLPVDLSPFPAAARLSPPLPSHTFLLSASLDRTLRLWGTDSCLRTFSGHLGPILCLADRIIGTSHSGTSRPAMGSSDASGSTPSYSFLPCIASGSSDSTVRVWSLLPSGKGRSACVATLKGHEGPITALAVAIHNPFLLTSVARDAKMVLRRLKNCVIGY